MTAIKKQFNDFKLYFKLTAIGVNNIDRAYKSNAVFIISMMVAWLLVFVQFPVMTGDEVFSMDLTVMFAPFAIGAAIGSGILSSKQPSLLSVSPFTPKQRMVFSYLAALLRAVFLFLIYFVFIVVAGFLVGCIFSIVEGKWVFTVEPSDASQLIPFLYVRAFWALIGIIFFFSAFAIAHMDNSKRRNATSVVFAAIVFALSLTLANVCGRCMDGGKVFYFSVNLTDGFAALSAPWAVIIVETVIAALAIAASAVFVKKRFASTDI